MFCSLKKGVTIYLYCRSASLLWFALMRAPTKIWVASLRGLPRFTRLFPDDSSLWHVKSPVMASRRHFDAVTHLVYPELLFPQAQSLHSSQNVLAWTFLTYKRLDHFH
jgi:hypothetical protein